MLDYINNFFEAVLIVASPEAREKKLRRNCDQSPPYRHTAAGGGMIQSESSKSSSVANSLSSLASFPSASSSSSCGKTMLSRLKGKSSDIVENSLWYGIF